MNSQGILSVGQDLRSRLDELIQIVVNELFLPGSVISGHHPSARQGLCADFDELNRSLSILNPKS